MDKKFVGGRFPLKKRGGSNARKFTSPLHLRKFTSPYKRRIAINF
jgi:hypothetical protein